VVKDNLSKIAYISSRVHINKIFLRLSGSRLSGSLQLTTSH